VGEKLLEAVVAGALAVVGLAVGGAGQEAARVQRRRALTEGAASGPLALEPGAPGTSVFAEGGLGEDEDAQPEQDGGYVLMVEAGVDGGRGQNDSADGGGVLVAAV
jgi:hypothetical protein